MSERMVVVARQPRELIWEALSERTCELAPFLDNIVSAEPMTPGAAPDGVLRRDHRWRARADVPAILAPHIDAAYLEWTCRTEWNADTFKSRWVVEPAFLKKSVLCEVLMEFLPAIGGRGTRMQLELELVGYQGPEGLRMITNRILSTHFRKLIEASSRLIEETQSPSPGEKLDQAPREGD